ncbi:MAG: TetR/AcrR family transcriptional regulator [Dehalococcoidia bacterium]|nr:TetR/AcrR family transcriptional regulator [Dehalococcoidia bacterium]
MDETRHRILSAAHRIFSAEGFHGATTKRIAAEAAVNEVTLFRHFPSKEQLLGAALDWHSAIAIAEIDANPLPSEPTVLEPELRTFLLDTLHGFLASHQAVRTTLGEWGHHPELDERLMRITNHVYDILERYLAAARAAGLIRTDTNIVVAAETLLAMIFADGMLRQVLPGRFPLAPPDSVSAYLDLVLHGMLPTLPSTPENT